MVRENLWDSSARAVRPYLPSGRPFGKSSKSEEKNVLAKWEATSLGFLFFKRDT